MKYGPLILCGRRSVREVRLLRARTKSTESVSGMSDSEDGDELVFELRRGPKPRKETDPDLRCQIVSTDWVKRGNRNARVSSNPVLTEK